MAEQEIRAIPKNGDRSATPNQPLRGAFVAQRMGRRLSHRSLFLVTSSRRHLKISSNPQVIAWTGRLILFGAARASDRVEARFLFVSQ